MTDETFDPADHTAAEVADALKEADPDTVAEIVDAEKQGKGRKGVLDAADARLDAIEEAKPEPRTDSRGRVLNPWEVAPAAEDSSEG